MSQMHLHHYGAGRRGASRIRRLHGRRPANRRERRRSNPTAKKRRRTKRRRAGRPAPADWESNRQTVGLLAILVGFLGIHKFVLGNNTPGLITLLVSLLTCGVGYPVMWAIGMVEGVRYLRMSDAEFYQTYVVDKKAWL